MASKAIAKKEKIIMKEIEQLIEISQKYGKDSRYVIAGGGNTSYKNAEKLWVKASGCALATITEDGFAVLDRFPLIRASSFSPPSIAKLSRRINLRKSSPQRRKSA